MRIQPGLMNKRLKTFLIVLALIMLGYALFYSQKNNLLDMGKTHGEKGAR